MSKSPSFAAVALFLLTVVGFRATAGDASAQQPESPPPPSESGAGLPAGHPVVTTPEPFTIKPVPPDSGTGASALSWTAPEGWIEEPPSSSMRRAQYRVTGPAGDAACIVYYFGPGQGGNAEDNAARWAQQFVQADGRPSTEVMKTETREVHGVEVLTVEVTGDYSGGMGGQAVDDAMLLGAIARGPDANWFFKLTGPEATLQQHRQSFEALVASIHRSE